MAAPSTGSKSPQPKTAISLAIFLHEVGHHVIGFEKYRRRCEEEFHVWMWALGEMRRFGVEPDSRVQRRVDMSMRYAVGKAVRRGIKTVPDLLCNSFRVRRIARKKEAGPIRARRRLQNIFESRQAIAGDSASSSVRGWLRSTPSSITMRIFASALF